MYHFKGKKTRKHPWILGWMRLAIVLCGFSIASFHMTPTNPVTGNHDVLAIREQYEISYGRKAMWRVALRGGGLYTDHPKINEYVRIVGEKIAKASDRPDLPYQFIVVKSKIPNAWALPGGKIAVNTGLLKMLDNEAQLAAILAHEIVHAAARHRAQSWERTAILNLTSQLQAVATPLSSYFAFSKLDDRLISYKHTRDSEIEADIYSLQYMKKAGYDPKAAIEVHHKLHQLHGEREHTLFRTLLSTHPSPTERMDTAKKQIGNEEKEGYKGSEVYAKIIRPLKKG